MKIVLPRKAYHKETPIENEILMNWSHSTYESVLSKSDLERPKNTKRLSNNLYP